MIRIPSEADIACSAERNIRPAKRNMQQERKYNGTSGGMTRPVDVPLRVIGSRRHVLRSPGTKRPV
jgi:hypothetical protein